jgi:Peptidase family M23
VRVRARYVSVLVAAVLAPLCVSACEILAGIHDVSLVLPRDGGSDADARIEGGSGTGGSGTGGSGTGDADAGSADAGSADAGGADAGEVTQVPAGYGSYCSLSYPDGAWVLNTEDDAETDPCAGVLAQRPGGTIERAGLYASIGANNVMVRCGAAPVVLLSGAGLDVIGAAREQVSADASLNGCVFTIAPASLPVFSLPYGVWMGQTDPGADVATNGFSAFNFDMYAAAWDVTDFGQTPYPAGSSACAVDRTGNEQCYFGSASECAPAPAGCQIEDPGRAAGGVYVWTMPMGKPLLAVANGIVRGSADRDVSSSHCAQLLPGTAQSEIYIEHQVGSGAQAERFIAGYLALSEREVFVGDIVSRGQEIGKAGSSGCSLAPQLFFSVLRLTNLTGARSYVFQTTPLGYGINGIQGAIDPAGWAAPMGIDPWAYRFLGYQDPLGTAPGVTDPGAFSIDLWLPGETPPVFP